MTNRIAKAILHLKAVAQSRTQKVVDIGLCLFGFFGMVYTTTLTIQSWANRSGGEAPGYCDE